MSHQPQVAMLSQQLIDNVADHITGVIFQFAIQNDGKSQFVLVTHNVADLLNITEHHLYQNTENFFNCLYSDDAEILKKAFTLSLSPIDMVVRTTNQQMTLVIKASPEIQQDSVIWTGLISHYHDTSQLIEPKQNALLDYTVDAISGLVMVIDQDGRCYSVNQSADGKDVNASVNIVNEYIDSFLPQPIVTSIKNAIAQCLVDSQPVKQEVSLGYQNKFWFDVAVSLAPKVKNLQRFILHIQDITKQKHNEQKILIDRVAMQNLSQGIVVCDAKQNVVAINQRFTEITGYSSEEIVGKNSKIKQGRLTSKKTVAEMREAIEQKKRYQGLILNYRKNGQTFWNNLTITPVLNNMGDVVNYVGVLEDVTEQLKQNERLAMSQIIFDTITQGIVILNGQLKVVSINQAFTNITQYEETEIVGTKFRFFSNQNNAPDEIEKLRSALKLHQDYIGEIQSYKRDHSLFWNEISITPIFDAAQHLKQFLVVIRDITEKKNVQQKLIESQRALLLTQDRYMDLYEFAPVGYVSISKTGVVLEANWKARSYIGVKRKDLGKERFSKCLHDKDKFYWQQQFLALFSAPSGFEFDLDVVIVLQNQKHVDVNLHCVRMNHEDHDEALLRVTMHDISEIKKSQHELMRRENYLRSLIDNFPFMVWLKDKQGKFLAVNQTYLDASGFEKMEDLIGKTDFDCWPIDLAESYHEDDLAVIKTAIPSTVDEMIELQGKRSWFETYKAPVISDDEVVGTVGFAYDVTERKHTMEYEKFRINMLEMVVKEPNSDMILSRIVEGIEALNPQMYCVIALLNHETMQLTVKVSPSVPATFVGELEGLKIAMGSGSIGTACYTKKRVIVEDIATHPYWITHKEVALAAGIRSGWAEPILNMDGQLLGAFGIYHNEPMSPSDFELHLIDQSARLVSIALEREQSFKHIETLAYTESVTGLHNRRHLVETLESMASKAEPPPKAESVGLIYIDIDRFKFINDTYGHEIGNHLLKQLGLRIKSILSSQQQLYSMGGDEFMVLVPKLGWDQTIASQQLEHVAQDIQVALASAFELQQYKFNLGASLGLAVISNFQLDVIEWIKRADIAMYQAKKAGRNCMRIYDPAMQLEISNQLVMQTELREAIRKNQLELYYQVQVDHLGQPFGAEALIRWNHPSKGLVPPIQFIPLAEESGIIVDMGVWILDRACKQIALWREDTLLRDLTVSVNISGKQFSSPDFISQVIASIERHQIDPNTLRLEITESILLDNLENVVNSMNELGALGVQFSLDDFGTGYSSLQYLKRLPIYQLKIDRSFVKDIENESHDRTIVRTIVAMAQSMYIGVIAEGVETLEQKELLLTNGCRRYQGYYFGKPVPATVFETEVKKNRLH